jgi:hypothetical protein
MLTEQAFTFMGCLNMTAKQIQRFLDEHTYDVRVTNNGRWIDQKCAFDSVCFVADCIIEYIQDTGKQTFTSVEIWHSQYAEKNVQHVFGKPDPRKRTTKDEYNKFFRQPMKMLSAAGVLSEKGKNPIQFTIENSDMLEHIAIRERNSFEFLCMYIEKVLRDSGLSYSFEEFFELQTVEAYNNIKQKFSNFCFKYTPITNAAEPNRIFIKVLNHLACNQHKKGTEKGHISSNIITFDKIAYNRTNWRDELTGKDKNVARGDYIPAPTNTDMFEYRVLRAQRYLSKFNEKYNGSRSEVKSMFAKGSQAKHMHHIFPKNEFREIADFIENLIAITSGQHMQEAHPDGNTKMVDKNFQYLCLSSKTETIRNNLLNSQEAPVIYKFEDFMYVLDVGLQTKYFSSLPRNDFNAVLTGIDKYY